MLNYSLTFYRVGQNGRGRDVADESVQAESDVEAILLAKDRSQRAARELEEPHRLACILMDENGDVVWRTPIRIRLTGSAPTIADTENMGVFGATVMCAKCEHVALLSFDSLGVAGATAFPLLARMNLKCQRCGAADPVVVAQGGR